MIRILGINISESKKLQYALTAIYGIGLKTAIKILNILNLNLNITIKELTSSQLTLLKTYLLNTKPLYEGELKKTIKQHIKTLITIKCYRGYRHLKGLPVRGQRTHTNHKTQKKFNRI